MSLLDRLRGDDTDETNSTDDQPEAEEAVEDDNDDESEEQVTVVVTEALHNAHTVHLAEAEFIDGDTKRFMFDAMKRKNGGIVLYDYTAYGRRGNRKEAFVTIPDANLKTFETTRREKVRKKVDERTRDIGTMARSEAEEVAEKYRENANIEEVKFV